MLSELTVKHYLEFCYIIANPDLLVEVFVCEFNLSQYELSNDFMQIKTIGKKYNIKIEKDKERIFYEVLDKEAFKRKYKLFCDYWFYHRLEKDGSDKFLQMELSKIILWNNNQYINVDDLAEKLGYARSSLRQPLKDARVFFNSYSINLNTVPHYGLKPAAKESDIRNCLTSLYLYHDNSIITETLLSEEAKYFNDEIYEQFAGKTEVLIKKYGMQFVKGQKKRFGVGLIVQLFRIMKGHVLVDNSCVEMPLIEKIKEKQNIQDFVIELVEWLEQKGYGPYNEFEKNIIVQNSLLALAYDNNVYNAVRELYSIEFFDLYYLVDYYLNDALGIAIDDEPYSSDLKRCLIDLILKNHTNTIEALGLNISRKPTQIYDYPIINKIQSDICNAISTYYNRKIPISHITNIATIIHYYIQTLDYNVVYPNVAISSRHNLVEPTMINNALQKRLKPIEAKNIEIVDYDYLFTSRANNTDKYDVVICDQKRVINDKVIAYGDSNYTFNYIIRFIRSKRDFCKNIIEDRNIVAMDYDFDSLNQQEELILKLSQKLEIDYETVKASFDDKAYHEDTLFIIIHSSNIKRNYLQIGEISNKYQFNKKTLKHYLILAANLRQDNLFFFNSVTRELVSDVIFFDNLKNKPSTTEINNQLTMLIDY